MNVETVTQLMVVESACAFVLEDELVPITILPIKSDALLPQLAKNAYFRSRRLPAANCCTPVQAKMALTVTLYRWCYTIHSFAHGHSLLQRDMIF
jgi:hypothetical protein